MAERTGPLKGVRIIELAGVGPGPFAGMLLADLGAEVICIDRPAGAAPLGGMDPKKDVMNRGRLAMVLDLKKPGAAEVVLRLVETADVLIEGNRPGVTERLGLGPEDCMARNPKLIYARMTGWGQTGQMAQRVGHDINYIALAGVLDMLGRKDERPMFPVNLVGDMGGGGMMMAFGIAAALFETSRSGKGQVIDAAMVDGSASLISGLLGMKAMGFFSQPRGENMIDSGAPFYDVYETKDGRYMAVGSIEPQFYALLVKLAELDPELFAKQMNPAKWPAQKAALTEKFKSKTQAEWTAIFMNEDACVTPVLTLEEATALPHNVERGLYAEQDGVLHQAPAPRFSRTPGSVANPPPARGQDTLMVLKDAKFSDAEIQALADQGLINTA